MLKSTLLTAITLSAVAVAGAKETPKKKNILFIAVDDLKPLIGAYGDTLAITPNLDRLASRGTLFTHAYCQQAISAATRASLLTGWCPDRTRVWDLKTLIRDMNPDVVTLPQHFIAHGYTTFGIGKIFDSRSVDSQMDTPSWSVPYVKWNQYIAQGYRTPLINCYQSEQTRAEYRRTEEQLKSAGVPKDKLRSETLKRVKPSVECIDVPDDAYIDGAVAKGAVQYIMDCDKDRTHFWAVGFKQPHLPFCAPSGYWDLYDRDRIPLAAYRKRAVDSPAYANNESGELRSYSDIPPLVSLSAVNNLELPDDKARELIHGYYAAVTYVDAQIGKVIDALTAAGQQNNTIIVLWGDHGWHLGDHGLWNKHTNFEQAVRAPLLIFDPDSEASVVDTPVEFLDIFPTLCDLTGIETPSGLDGESLSELMKDPDAVRERGYAASQYPRSESVMGYTLRTERYRYTVWYGWKKRRLDSSRTLAEELYDYQSDPLERANLVGNKEYHIALSDMRMLFEQYKQDRFVDRK